MRSYFFEGVIDSLPICLSFSFMCMAFGTLAHAQHLTAVTTILMTVWIYALPVQLAILYSLHNDPSIAYILFITLVINFRFVFNAMAIAKYFKTNKLSKVLAVMFIFSASSFIVSYTKYHSSDIAHGKHLQHFLGVALPSYLVAISTTIIGYYLIHGLNNHALTLIFTIVLPLHFTALTAKRYPNISVILATVCGFITMPFLEGSNFMSVVFAMLIGLVFAYTLSL